MILSDLYVYLLIYIFGIKQIYEIDFDIIKTMNLIEISCTAGLFIAFSFPLDYVFLSNLQK